MTRINCIPVAELHDKHLVAEYRELPRVYRLAVAAHRRGETESDARNPGHYTLGPGHVRFFYQRLGYIVCRQRELIAEMQRRGFATRYAKVPVPADVYFLPQHWLNYWEPDEQAMALNRARIAERIDRFRRR